jgi:hypothetical protein
LTKAFQQIGGVPEEILCDRMTTINIRGGSYRLKDRHKAGLVPRVDKKGRGRGSFLGLGLRSAQNAPKDDAGLAKEAHSSEVTSAEAEHGNLGHGAPFTLVERVRLNCGLSETVQHATYRR